MTSRTDSPSISLPSALRSARISVSPAVPGSGAASTPQSHGSTTLLPGSRFSSASSTSRSSQSPSILPPSSFLNPRRPRQAKSSTQARTSVSSIPSPSSASSHYTNVGTDVLHISAAEARLPTLPEQIYQNVNNDYAVLNVPGVPDVDLSRNSSHRSGHARAESRQETIASKASREPLLLERTTAMPTLPESPVRKNNKRHGSKTSSIGSLLGFVTNNSSLSGRNKDTNDPFRSEKRSPTNHSGGLVHATRDLNEKVDSRQQHMLNKNLHLQRDLNAKDGAVRGSGPHAVVHVTDADAHKPLRNYQAYRAGQKATKLATRPKHTSDNTASAEVKQALGYGSELTGGNTRFYLSGRLITSGDSPFPFLASLAVMLLLPAAFFAFESQWLWNSGSSTSGISIGTVAGRAITIIFAYLTIMMWLNMLRTALRDPGIIPKGLHRDPDLETYAVPVGGVDDLTGTGMGSRAQLRMLRVRDEVVSSKWCETCQTYRPPRTSHCRLCDVCTEQTDHHCSFLNNCIGRRNYTSFMVFLISTTLCALLVVGVSVAHLVIRATAVGANAFLKDWRTAGTLAVLAITIFTALPIIGLLVYHTRLIWLGRTTIEMVSCVATSFSSVHAHKAFVSGSFGHDTLRAQLANQLIRMRTQDALIILFQAYVDRWTCTLPLTRTAWYRSILDKQILHSRIWVIGRSGAAAMPASVNQWESGMFFVAMSLYKLGRSLHVLVALYIVELSRKLISAVALLQRLSALTGLSLFSYWPTSPAYTPIPLHLPARFNKIESSRHARSARALSPLRCRACKARFCSKTAGLCSYSTSLCALIASRWAVSQRPWLLLALRLAWYAVCQTGTEPH